jgi:hypothetical protein
VTTRPSRPDLRVLAASFRDGALARAAQARLVAELGLEPHQVGVESLAEAGDGDEAQAILAGHFREDLVDTARQIVEQHGGTVMVDTADTERNA